MAKILVVDDRPTNRQFLMTLLGYGGHRLIEASDGAEALDLARAEHPDLVITDILMPTMDGYEFASGVRKDPDIAKTPIVFYTATYSSPEARLLADSCGVRTVLRKPAEPAELLAAIDLELGIAMPPAPATAAPRRLETQKPQRAGDQAAEYFKEMRAAGAMLDATLSDPESVDRAQMRKIGEKFSGEIANLQRLTSRLTTLTEIAMDMMTVREPERMVERFFRAACRMIPSECAAVGLFEETGRGLKHLFAKGIDPAVYDRNARTGNPASLAYELRFLRIDQDAAQPGTFPAGHPPVRSLLGGPVVHADQAHGWIYFANSEAGKPFSDEDERVASTLGSMLALLHEHVMLFDTVQRHAAHLQIEMTGRKQAESAARDSEFRFRQLTENIAEVFWLTDPAKNEMLYISPAYEKIWGRSCEALYASPRDWLDALHPDDRERVLAAATAKQARGDYNEEYRIVRPDGSIRWIHDKAFPVRDPAGRVYRIAGVAEDITERKRAIEALRESERRFSDMMGKVELISLMVDRDARITYCNDYLLRLTGWTRDQMLGRTAFELLVPPEQNEARNVFNDLLADLPRASHHEREMLTKSGERRLVRWNNTVLRSVTGEVIGAASIGEDITEQKRAETRIRALNRVYAVLSGINALIVRAKTREELFQEACRIAVDAGHFVIAWIGVVDPEGLKVAPVASAGDVRDFFDSAPLARSHGSPQGKGMAWRVIREKKAVISNDVQNDPRTLLKRQCADRDVNSFVILPLVVGDESIGVLSLYAREPGFFDEQEMKLLDELAGDISFALDHVEKANRLDYLAYYDAATGIANRRLLLERVDQRIRVAGEKKGRLALAILDIERFKNINDTLGRHTGDQLLKMLAERLTTFLGDADRVGRVLGDQFGVVIPDVQNEDDVARRIDRKLRECVGLPLHVGGKELRVSARAGVALYPEDGANADELYRNAESALKRAKATSERFLFYTQKMTERVAEKLALENQLRQALENDEFVLHYQPKVDTATRKIEAVEALIRWQSPALGLVPPGQFIPLLEETGLILEVGAWALRRATMDYRRWLGEGLAAPRIAVNVSAIQVRRLDFVETTLAAVTQDGVRSAIDLEVTESLVMEDIGANIVKFEALRRAGMEIAIDDFGTGYSSLAYLAKLPVQLLKIDRSFIHSMLKDEAVMTLVSTMVSLAHTLKLKLVAEGVESEEQAGALKRLGCDQLQGYLVGKPQPFDEVVKLLGTRRRGNPGGRHRISRPASRSRGKQ